MRVVLGLGAAIVVVLAGFAVLAVVLIYVLIPIVGVIVGALTA